MNYRFFRNSDLLYLFPFLGLICVLISVFFKFPVADDYGYFHVLKFSNVFTFMFENYMNWDGRFLSLEAFLMSFGYKYLPVQFIVLIKFFVYLSILYICSDYFSKKQENRFKLFLIVFVLITISLKQSFFEVVLWSCGGYIYTMFFVVVYLKYLKDSSNRGIKLFFLFLFGLTSPNIALFYFLTTLESLTKINTANLFNWLKNNYLEVVMIFLSFSIVLFSPGNESRGFKFGSVSIEQFANSYISYSFYFVKSAFYIFLSGFLVSLLGIVNREWKINNFRVLAILLSFNIISIMPYALAGHFPLRALWINYFAFFGVAFIIGTMIKRNKIILKVTNDLKLIQHIVVVIVISGSIFISYSAFKSVKLGVDFYEREKVIERHDSNDDVVVNMINMNKRSFLDSYKDITTDSTHWINKHAAEYYDVKSISTK